MLRHPDSLADEPAQALQLGTFLTVAVVAHVVVSIRLSFSLHHASSSSWKAARAASSLSPTTPTISTLPGSLTASQPDRPCHTLGSIARIWRLTSSMIPPTFTFQEDHMPVKVQVTRGTTRNLVYQDSVNAARTSLKPGMQLDLPSGHL